MPSKATTAISSTTLNRPRPERRDGGGSDVSVVPVAVRSMSSVVSGPWSVVVAGMHVQGRDPLGPEHLDITAIVFERELQVETERAQVPHRRLLEVAGHLVVTPGPHHEQ